MVNWRAVRTCDFKIARIHFSLTIRRTRNQPCLWLVEAAKMAMWLIDSILNVAALLLWLKCQERDVSSIIAEPRISVVATLRRATPKYPRLRALGALAALLFGRWLFYLLVGPAMEWTAKLHFGPIPLFFRSDFWHRILLYSFLAFGVTLAVYYLSLLLLSALDRSIERDPVQKFIRSQLGWLDGLALALKMILPWLGGAIAWCGLHPLLQVAGIVPEAKSLGQLVQQAMVLGLGVYLIWKYVLLALLLLYLLNSYVYFGAWPVWTFIEKTGSRLLKPLAAVPLRIGKFDFAPIVAMTIVFVVSEYLALRLVLIYERL